MITLFLATHGLAQSNKKPQMGPWRAELSSQGGGLPFNLHVAPGKRKIPF